MAIAIPKKKKYTYEDYAKLPEGAPYQLIGGELIMTPNSHTLSSNSFAKNSVFISSACGKE